MKSTMLDTPLQDARNIVRKMENALKHRHSNDALSVDRLVKELQNEAYPLLKLEPIWTCLAEWSHDTTFHLVTMFKKHSEKVECVS